MCDVHCPISNNNTKNSTQTVTYCLASIYRTFSTHNLPNICFISHGRSRQTGGLLASCISCATAWALAQPEGHQVPSIGSSSKYHPRPGGCTRSSEPRMATTLSYH